MPVVNMHHSGNSVWLLDVDGVLNATHPGWGAPPCHGQAWAEGMTFPMRWSPLLITELLRMHYARTVEFRWATTWVNEIHQIQRLFGLPPFPVAVDIPATGSRATASAAKAEAATRIVAEEHRPLIWSDDEATLIETPVLDRLRSGGHPVLILAPDPRRGLQPEDLRLARDFLADPWGWACGDTLTATDR